MKLTSWLCYAHCTNNANRPFSKIGPHLSRPSVADEIGPHLSRPSVADETGPHLSHPSVADETGC